MLGFKFYGRTTQALQYLAFVTVLLAISCKKKYDNGELLPPPSPPAPTVFLKDLVLSNLPSPYYHFEYSADGRVNFVSFASEFFRYNIIYDGNRISEMRNDILVNKDRLQYKYDNQGRVNEVDYADSTGL